MAMSIIELKTKRANLWEETKKFLTDHTDADGKMAAADAEAYQLLKRAEAEAEAYKMLSENLTDKVLSKMY